MTAAGARSQPDPGRRQPADQAARGDARGGARHPRPQGHAADHRGRALFGRAKRMLALNDEIWTEMTTPELRGRDPARHPGDIVTTYLPAFLKGFARPIRRVRESRLQRSSAELLEALWRRRLDCGARRREDRQPTARTSSWTGSSGSAHAAGRRRFSVRCRFPSAAATARSAPRSARSCRRPASNGARCRKSRTRRAQVATMAADIAVSGVDGLDRSETAWKSSGPESGAAETSALHGQSLPAGRRWQALAHDPCLPRSWRAISAKCKIIRTISHFVYSGPLDGLPMDVSEHLHLEGRHDVLRPSPLRDEHRVGAPCFVREAQALRESHARAAREKAAGACVAVMAMSASSMRPRAFTSTNAMVSPRITIRSISPPAAE